MLPRRSPFGLLQEDVWPNDWMILIVAMMLNCTSRRQVEKVLPTFMDRWCTPQAFMDADEQDVVALCKPLGFANRRTKNMFRMTERYLSSSWDDPRELPGVGEYGARSYEIFCMGKLGDEAPKGHALVRYYEWSKRSVPVNLVVRQELLDDVPVNEERCVGDRGHDVGAYADQPTVSVERASS